MSKLVSSKCKICKEKHMSVVFHFNADIFWKVRFSDELCCFGGIFCSLECFNNFLEKFNLIAIPDKLDKNSILGKISIKIIKIKHKGLISEKLRDIPYRTGVNNEGGEEVVTLIVLIRDLQPIKRVSKKKYIQQLKQMEKSLINLSEETHYIEKNEGYTVISH